MSSNELLNVVTGFTLGGITVSLGGLFLFWIFSSSIIIDLNVILFSVNKNYDTDVAESDVAESDVEESDVAESDITESDITESDVADNDKEE